MRPAFLEYVLSVVHVMCSLTSPSHRSEDWRFNLLQQPPGLSLEAICQTAALITAFRKHWNKPSSLHYLPSSCWRPQLPLAVSSETTSGFCCVFFFSCAETSWQHVRPTSDSVYLSQPSLFGFFKELFAFADPLRPCSYLTLTCVSADHHLRCNSSILALKCASA